MGLSGISALLNFRGNESFVHVDDFNIYRNTIQHCALQIPEVPSKLVIAAAVLAAGLGGFFRFEFSRRAPGLFFVNALSTLPSADSSASGIALLVWPYPAAGAQAADHRH